MAILTDHGNSQQQLSFLPRPRMQRCGRVSVPKMRRHRLAREGRRGETGEKRWATNGVTEPHGTTHSCLWQGTKTAMTSSNYDWYSNSNRHVLNQTSLEFCSNLLPRSGTRPNLCGCIVHPWDHSLRVDPTSTLRRATDGASWEFSYRKRPVFFSFFVGLLDVDNWFSDSGLWLPKFVLCPSDFLESGSRAYWCSVGPCTIKKVNREMRVSVVVKTQNSGFSRV